MQKNNAEERDHLRKMLDEGEQRQRWKQKQITEGESKIKWLQEQVTKLTTDLSQSEQEATRRQFQINDLKGKAQQNKDDKLRAFDEVKTLSAKIARQTEEMDKIRREGQDQLEALRGELALSCQRNTELESQVAEAEKRAAQLRDEHDAACDRAFRFGEEETRAKFFRERPEWDLSFLEAEGYDARTSGTGLSTEMEYGEISDLDVDAILGVDKIADSGVESRGEGSRPSNAEGSEAPRSATFETGEPSRPPPMLIGNAPETEPES